MLNSILSHLPVILFFLFGVIVWFFSCYFEGRVLRFAYAFLVFPASDEDRNGKREIVLARAGVALRAARLGRIVAAMVIPTTVAYYLYAEENVRLTPWKDLYHAMILLLIGLIFMMVMVAIWAFPLRRFYDPPHTYERHIIPRWMTDTEKPVPGPVAAASILWNWFFRFGELFSRSLGVSRQKAYLFEREDELLVAIGKKEVEEFGDEEERLYKNASNPDRTEEEMIRAIQRLDHTLVREVMRPLNKVTAVNIAHFSPLRLLALARRTGYTRFPCYTDQITNLNGYLNIYDLLHQPQLPEDLKPLAHDALFIPEVAYVDVVLQEMIRRKIQIGICFDEFGGCSGLLSREDIFEEIIGDIMDEHDRVEEALITHRRGDFLVDASIDLDDLDEEIGFSLKKENCDTLAGYIYHRLSRLPRRGEMLDENGWKIEIVQMDQHRLQKVRLIPPPSDKPLD